MVTTALESSDITKIGIGVIVGLIVLGFVLSLIITAIIGRLIIAAVVIIAGATIWQQRSSVLDDLTTKACGLDTTFFGVHVDPPSNVTQYCATHHR